uniref:Retrotransposon Copia-like N-terminal domain-containing protein n=1 Tax=Salix viminalis TaxID=40686 RepID=A0A6N2N5R1_SALVM
MVSELAMESPTTSVVSPATTPSLDFAPSKTHLPDISTKLASNNYLLWKAQVVPILRGHGLLGYVTDEVPCPALTIVGADGAAQPNSAAATWLRIDQLILGWINSSLSDGPLSQVINCESSHDDWNVLETLYGSHTRDRIQQIKGELQTLTKGTFSLEDYLHKAKSLALSLRGAGKPIDEDDLIICILRGLGSEFDPIVAALNACDMFPSLEGVIGKLRDFEIRLQGTRTQQSSVAFYTKKNRFHTRSQGNQNPRNRSGGYQRMPFQSRNRDTRPSRFGDNSSGTTRPSFTRGQRNSGRGRGGVSEPTSLMESTQPSVPVSAPASEIPSTSAQITSAEHASQSDIAPPSVPQRTYRMMSKCLEWWFASKEREAVFQQFPANRLPPSSNKDPSKVNGRFFFSKRKRQGKVSSDPHP